MADNSAQNLPQSLDATYDGHRLVVFTAAFIPLQVLSVILRYYARWMLRIWGADDYIVLASLVMQITIGALCIDAVNHAGVGFHVSFLTATDPDRIATWGKYLIALSTLYFAAVNLPKFAILILYHRVFPNPNIRIAVYILAAVLVCLSISNVIVDLAACRPFEANWKTADPGAKCIDKEAFFIWGSIPNIITDVAMLAVPMPVVWKLHTNKRMKVGLTVTFTVGSFGLVTSIIRFTTFFKNNSFTDGTFTAVELLIWTQVEAGVYLISACLLTYRPLLERLLDIARVPRRSQTTTTNKGYSSGRGRSRHLADNISTADIPLKEGSSTASAHSQAWHWVGDKNSEDQAPGITITTDIRVNGQRDREDSIN